MGILVASNQATLADQIQKLTDSYVAEVDKRLENKEKDLMEV
jgi:ribosome recycling factor